VRPLFADSVPVFELSSSVTCEQLSRFDVYYDSRPARSLETSSFSAILTLSHAVIMSIVISACT
jgi:hypothetical protein